MKHSLFFSLVVFIAAMGMATPLKAQIVLQGDITTETDEPVAFAAVVLQQLPDTTEYNAVITDMAGGYRFGK